MEKIVRKQPGLTRSLKAGLTLFGITALSLSAYGGDVIGKVVAGYQGWLCASGDGSPVDEWKHTNLECWPDVREYTTTYSGCPFSQAGVKKSPYYGDLGNGQPAKMFSNWNDQTVKKHFEWMQQYGIDCAALQRFGSELKDSRMKAYRDGIANKVKTAAQTYGRKYYIMYDISNWTAFPSEIKTDWTKYMKAHTDSSAYAKENGKPVVCIWGIGFSNRPGNVNSWTDVVNWFKGQGCYVIGGVPGKFNTDTTNKNAYKACDMVMAWRVGSTLNPFTVYGDHLSWCNNNGVAYQGAVYPGYSFYNSDTSKPKNEIKRMHGDFMWNQFAAAKNKGVAGIYVSMFDEVQEATQIFKVAEKASQIPAGKYFLTLDADGVACSSDFYLRLTQDGGKMFKGQIPYTTSHPTAHTLSAEQTASFTSIAAEDGYLNESTETSNIGGGFNATGSGGAGLRIGDTSSKLQHKSVVSFNTSSLPDGAVIQSATLKLTRGEISGTPTNLGNIKVDIKGGSGFNNAVALSKGDFEAAADATGVATMSYPSANGTLSTGNLNATGLSKISKTGKTQLRIYFATDDDNDAVSDYIGFYSAENSTAANRPVLQVTYQ